MNINFKSYLSLIVLVLLLIGCDSKQDVATHIQNAKQYQKDKKIRPAIIELKNALQQEPNNVEARRLLGTIYIDSGKGPSAEKELTKAISLGVPEDELIVELAKSYVLQRDFDKALKTLTVKSSFNQKKKGEIYVLLGDIYFAKSDTKGAEASYKKALQEDSSGTEALVGLAKIHLINGKYKKAGQVVSPITESAKNYVDKLLVQAEVATRLNELDKAEKLYKEVIDLSLKTNLTHIEYFARNKLIRVLVFRDKVDDALIHVNHMLKGAPNSPLPKYLRGLVAYKVKDYDVALEYLQQVEAKAPSHLQNTLLLGAVHFATGSYEQSNTYLTRFVNEVPTHLQARKLLGVVRLKLNKPAEAVDVLKAAASDNEADANLLTIIGQAATASGDSRQGEQYLRKAMKANPGSSSIRAELAKIYLNEGAYDNAINELESVRGEEGLRAKLLLVYTYLRKEDFNKAKSTINNLIKENPKSPALWTVSGGVQLISGNRNESRKHFYQALEFDENFTVALLNLARIEFEDGRLTEAEKLYEKILLNDDKQIAAMMGMAQLAEGYGKMDEAINWLDKAHKANKKAVMPRLVLGKYYLTSGNPEKALAVLEDSDSSYQKHHGLLRLHTAAQIKLGRTEQAISTYLKAVENSPNNAKLRFEISAIYSELKKYQLAKTSLEKAISLKKDYLQAKTALAVIEMKMNNLHEALMLAEKIQKEHSKSAAGYALAGDIYSRQNKLKQARRSYQQGMKLEPSGILVDKIHQLSKALKDYKFAVTVVTDWLDKNPKDARNRMNLALTYQAQNQAKKAEMEYLKVLQLQPNNVLVMNNLAYLLINSDLKSALHYSKKAYDLKPNNYAIMDTYAWILLKSGDAASSLPILEVAVGKSQGNPSIRYHYAVALHQQKKTDKARNELTEILNSKKAFPERAAAKKYLDRIL